MPDAGANTKQQVNLGSGMTEILQPLTDDSPNGRSFNQTPPRSRRACYETMDVVQQWLTTWRQTGDARHLETALICWRIARERFSTGPATVEAKHIEWAFSRIGYQPNAPKVMAAIQESVASSRRSADEE